MSDGDSKTYLNLCDKEPYGKNVAIIKHECVGHVQKRMGKALRDVKKKPVHGYAEDVKATKAARTKFARDQRKQRKQQQTASRGKGRATRRGRGRGTTSAPVALEVTVIDPKVAVPPIMVFKRLTFRGFTMTVR